MKEYREKCSEHLNRLGPLKKDLHSLISKG